MRAAVRSGAGVAVALALTGTVAVAPVTPPLAEIHLDSPALRLAAGESILNVPLNLLIDLANVPANEINALNQVADSLFFTGSWWVPSSTNLWGTDPGDPGHWQMIVDLLAPFPALSGASAYDTDGLGYQLWNYAAAELPVSDTCKVGVCEPLLPMNPLTGLTVPDAGLNIALILAGLQKFPLVDGWNTVPLATLMSGYTYGDVVNPAGPVNPGFGFEGTTGADNNLMPWSGDTFTYNPLQPFLHFLESLVADPSTNQLQIADPLDFVTAMKDVLAGLVIDFDPFTPGGTFCPGQCDYVPLTIPDIVKLIAALPGGNGDIDTWLAAWESGEANWATEAQIQATIQDLSLQNLIFDTPNTAGMADVLTAVSTQLNELLADLFGRVF